MSDVGGAPRSYTSTRTSPTDRARELWNLFLFHRRDIGTRIDRVIERAEAADARISQMLGAPMRGCRLVELGPGQRVPYLTYFAASNFAIGIDLDVIVEQFSLRRYT